jgi:hypothetical protein
VRILPLLLTAGLLLSGCATHMQTMGSVRYPLYAGDAPSAAQAFEAKKAKPDDLLWLLEKGHLCHLEGDWRGSNGFFERAERKADELYTKSVLKGAASLVISDKVLPYSSPLFEMSLIPYYRSLNYMNLGLPDEALVEARKSDFAISRYSEKAAGRNAAPAAFLTYLTGLLYAAEGQWDNALISYRNAHRQYSALKGGPPATLAADYYLAARRMGVTGEVRDLAAKDPALPARAEAEAGRNVILFVETGFVPYKSEVTITLPILELRHGEGADGAARRYVDTFGATLFSYRHTEVSLKQVLQFAFPVMEDFPLRARSTEAGPADGTVRSSQTLLDLSPVAHDEFGRSIPGMLLKTVARALAKEWTRHEAKKQGGDLVGWAVNLLNIATEQADTRSWFLLPRRIELVKLTLPEGRPQNLVVRSLSGRGFVVEERTIPVTVAPGEVKWLSVRFYQ